MIQHKHNRAIAGRIVVQATKPTQTFSTQMQSPSFRRKILDAAKRDFRAYLTLIRPKVSSVRPAPKSDTVSPLPESELWAPNL